MKRTVNSVIEQIKSRVEKKLSLDSVKVNLHFPAKRYSLVAYKLEQTLQLWGQNDENNNVFIKEYPLTAFSGIVGPKLQEGDLQIPEGIYEIESLNPDSKYYLSVRLNYPNAFDKKMGETDGRANLGSDIYIHGGKKSIGCIAIGDKAIEEIFYITATTGIDKVIIAPCYFQNNQPVLDFNLKIHWYDDLLRSIHFQLQSYQLK